MANEKTIDFEKELNRLDEILDKISSKTLPLDDSLKLYQEGQEIVKKLEEALVCAQEKVEKIVTIE